MPCLGTRPEKVKLWRLFQGESVSRRIAAKAAAFGFSAGAQAHSTGASGKRLWAKDLANASPGSS